MLPSSPFASSWLDTIDARWPGARRRAGSIALAIVLELVLLLILLTLGGGGGEDRSKGEILTTFDTVRDDTAENEEPETQPDTAAAPAQPAEPAQPAATAQPAAPAQPAPSVPTTPNAMPSSPPIALPRTPTAPPILPPTAQPAAPAETLPSPGPAKIRAVVRSDMAGNRGPTDTGAPGDSQRIAGSGPNGEPLYAAKWYREPTDDEFRGYFSRVDGSAWALINCRTEPEFRVDHCVLVDEWPDRSGVGSAVLAMAWQFRVRPPRVGGRSLVGEWVRIRIEYTVRGA